MVLPVGADGKVSFFTNLGATDLTVSVVGYYVDPDAPLRVRRKIAVDGGDKFDAVRPQPGLLRCLDRKIRSFQGGDCGQGRHRSGVLGGRVSVTVDKGKGTEICFVYPAGADRPKSALLSYGRDAERSRPWSRSVEWVTDRRKLRLDGADR